MNLYALNETPINGWKTHLGSGQAAMALAASGVSADVDLGTGSAKLTLLSSGNGARRVPAFGKASTQIVADGNGTRRVLGSATAAMVLDAEGDGEVVESTGGRAIMAMMASGVGGILANGEGAAEMRIDATGEGRVAKTHFGSSRTIMEFRAWDIPKRYSTYHGSGTAVMRASAVGVGAVICQNGGAASMQIKAQGAGRAANFVRGYGYADLRLIASRVESGQHRQISGSGSATISLKASTRINRVVMLPSSYEPAPRARSLSVATENRVMRVSNLATHKLAEA